MKYLVKEEEFVEAIKGSKLSKTSREAAYLVLVDGWTQVDAGAHCNLSKQRMSNIIGNIERRIEQIRATTTVSGNDQVAVVAASYAFAVKAARDKLGDQVRIRTPAETMRTVGLVIARTDFHLVQSLGRDSVMIHDLANLDRVPTVGEQATIQYQDGHGVVNDQKQRPKEKYRSGDR
jgi:hypothetical protein